MKPVNLNTWNTITLFINLCICISLYNIDFMEEYANIDVLFFVIFTVHLVYSIRSYISQYQDSNLYGGKSPVIFDFEISTKLKIGYDRNDKYYVYFKDTLFGKYNKHYVTYKTLEDAVKAKIKFEEELKEDEITFID